MLKEDRNQEDIKLKKKHAHVWTAKYSNHKMDQ